MTSSLALERVTVLSVAVYAWFRLCALAFLDRPSAYVHEGDSRNLDDYGTDGERVGIGLCSAFGLTIALSLFNTMFPPPAALSQNNSLFRCVRPFICMCVIDSPDT